MGLADLSPPITRHWTDFWWYNWIDHQQIQQAVQAKLGINNPIYCITPWTEEGKGTLLQLHQSYHDDMNLALGLNSQDLSALDMNDPEKLRQWVFEHYNEHQSARAKLGI